MNQDKRTSRVIISVCLLGVFLLLFAGRLVQLQLVHGAEYAEQGKSISSASTRVEAARGDFGSQRQSACDQPAGQLDHIHSRKIPC